MRIINNHRVLEMSPYYQRRAYNELTTRDPGIAGTINTLLTRFGDAATTAAHVCENLKSMGKELGTRELELLYNALLYISTRSQLN